MLENGGVINDGIRPPHERHAIYLTVCADEWQGSELCRELSIGGNLRYIERRCQPGSRDRGGDITGRRNPVVCPGAASAQLGHELVARSHVRSGDLTVILVFERFYE